MTITRLEPGPRMSKAVIHGDTIYLAGQVGNPGTSLEEQTTEALNRVEAILKDAGSDKSKLLQVTVWLSDIANFSAMNAVYDKWIDPANPPARACGESRLATPEHLVEFIVIAAR